ncbi:hypothetical protein D3C79_1021110 [compost metagenome]
MLIDPLGQHRLKMSDVLQQLTVTYLLIAVHDRQTMGLFGKSRQQCLEWVHTPPR